MKRKLIILFAIVFLSFPIFSCGSSGGVSNGAPGASGGDGYGSTGDEIYGDGPGDWFEPDASGPTNGSEKEEGDVQAGQITASAWSDNENFDYWKDLITKSNNASEQEKHYLASTYEAFNNKAPGLIVNNMYKIVLTSNGTPLNNAKVTVKSASNKLFSGVTNAAGTLYVFLDQLYDTNVTLEISYNGQTHEELINTLEDVTTIDIPSFSLTNIEVLDLALVIDTTGSMSDELNYLKKELQNVLETISETNKNIKIRLALVFYRDNGDRYVTKEFDFTSDLATQYKNLNAEIATGGGDTPEAVHDSLTSALNLSWSEQSTKILIDVCDAPPHSNSQILQSVVASTIAFAEKGIRVVPVICSGSDYLTELVFRQAALYTGGTYTYITDHSGIGNSHTDPATPSDVVVEYLNKLLIRLITEYITGKDIPPVAYNAQDKHTISFDTQGGSKINVQIVENNGYLTKVENPTKEGYIFGGWIIKDNPKELFSYDTPVTSSFTLQAIWLANEVEEGYLVIFNTNNDQKINTQFVLPGDLVNKPADPVKEGYTFVGWFYTENSSVLQFDFNTPITKSIELNAIYIENK